MLQVTQTDWRTGLIGAKSTVKTVIPHYSFLNPNKTFESFTLAQKFGHLCSPQTSAGPQSVAVLNVISMGLRTSI